MTVAKDDREFELPKSKATTSWCTRLQAFRGTDSTQVRVLVGEGVRSSARLGGRRRVQRLRVQDSFTENDDWPSIEGKRNALRFVRKTTNYSKGRWRMFFFENVQVVIIGLEGKITRAQIYFFIPIRFIFLYCKFKPKM